MGKKVLSVLFFLCAIFLFFNKLEFAGILSALLAFFLFPGGGGTAAKSKVKDHNGHYDYNEFMDDDNDNDDNEDNNNEDNDDNNDGDDFDDGGGDD